MDSEEELLWMLYLQLLLGSAFCAIQLCLDAKNPNRRWWVRPITHQRHTEGDFQNLFRVLYRNDHEQFFDYLRMSPQQFDTLLELLKPALTKRSIRRPLSPAMRLAMTVKYLAHSGSYRSLAWEFRVGTSTARKIVPETCRALWEILMPLYMGEPTLPDWTKIADEFWNTWNFPNCVGALDGKHIRCKSPPKSGSLFFNYKKYFSVVLMATCNANYEFTWVDIGDYGHKNDGSVFSNSSFGKLILEESIAFPAPRPLPGSDRQAAFAFVADAAFPLKECILKPYPLKNLTQEQRVFNYRLSRARRTIENSFGILCSRWQIFHQVIQGSAQTVTSITQAATVLHNFIMKTNGSRDDFDKAAFKDEENWRKASMDPYLQNLKRIGSNNPKRADIIRQNTMLEYFLTDAGEVPWQYDMIIQGCH